mmetsp:Transcript_14536/g.12798  ORF Transcript_14536/g.12798 Transcript_14536/m.12798 type:complete len:85 (+) Transcript_14536:400-654(+)
MFNVQKANNMNELKPENLRKLDESSRCPLNHMISLLKDEVKPMFLFNAKYQTSGSSRPDSQVMTPQFQERQRYDEDSSSLSRDN